MLALTSVVPLLCHATKKEVLATYVHSFLESRVAPRFIHPSYPELFRDVNLPFYNANDAEVEGRTKVSFFESVFKTLKWKRLFEAAGSNQLDWKTIINHAVEGLYEQDWWKGRAGCPTTKRLEMVTMIKSWLGSFRCLFDLYLGKLCALLVLSTLTEELLSFLIVVAVF